MYTPQELNNIKVSFSSAVDKLKTEINSMEKEFNEKESETTNLLRSFASIKSRCDNILREVGIKPSKEVSELTDFEITNMLSGVDEIKKEELIAYISKLKKREEEIKNNKVVIDRIIKDLAHLSMNEEDTKEELVMMSMPKLKEDEPENLDDTFDIESILDFAEDDFLANLKDYDKEIIPEKENDEIMIYEIEDNVSLVDIATSVYKNASYWSNLYEYGNNKAAIDERINGLDIKDFVYDKRILTGISLEIPKSLTVYEHKVL